MHHGARSKFLSGAQKVILATRTATEHNYRYFRMKPAHVEQRLDPVHAGHEDIEQKNTVVMTFEQVQRLPPIISSEARKTRLLQADFISGPH